MKILIISSFYPPYIGGGAERMVEIQAVGLSKRGHQVTVLTLTNEKSRVEELKGNIHIVRYPIPNIYWHLHSKLNSKIKRLVWHILDAYNFKSRILIKHFLMSNAFDVAICNNIAGWSVSIWGVLHMFNIPIVQVVHDYYFLCSNSNMLKNGQVCRKQCGLCRVLKSIIPIEAVKVDALIGVSKTVLSKIEKFSLFENATHYVVYNAKNIKETDTILYRRSNCPLRIGYIGTISPVKGVLNLIKAFKQRKIDAELLIAGDFISKSYEFLLRKEAEGDACIQFLGYYNSNDFFRLIDIAVFPSIWEEPFGLVAVEACANHIPCIVPFSGGLSEIISENVNGLYCDPTSPNSILEKIELLYNDYDLYCRLVKNCRHSINRFIDVENMLIQYENVILDCKRTL